jgi:photosynthetic reaction center H subunit
MSAAITTNMDVAQLTIWAFWFFFAGLIIYLRREDKREGYPLDSDRTERSGGRVKVVGFPDLADPKTFVLPHGAGTVMAPRVEAADKVNATPVAPFPAHPSSRTAIPCSPASARPLRRIAPSIAI